MKSICAHFWKYKWCVDGRERRFCSICDKRQVRGFRKGDTEKWYDSLWAAAHSFTYDTKRWHSSSINISEL